MTLRNLLAALLLSTLSVACAHADKHAIYVGASESKTYKAVVKTLAELDYAVLNSDPTTGVVTAERVMDGANSTGRTFKVNVRLREGRDGTSVFVRFDIPAGAVGSTDSELREIADGLERRLPKAEVVIDR